MTLALVVAVNLPAPLLVVGIAISLGLAVLVAHWASPKTKRMVAAGAVAASLVTVAPPPVHTAEVDFVIRDTCQDYEPWSVMWILKGCMWP